MNNHVLFIQWGNPVVGRESVGVEVFQMAVSFYQDWKNRGDIADVWTIGFDQGNLSELAGCMVITGTADQIEALWRNDKHRELRYKASCIVNNLTFSRGVTGELVMERVKEIAQARKSLGY